MRAGFLLVLHLLIFWAVAATTTKGTETTTVGGPLPPICFPVDGGNCIDPDG